MQSDEYLLELAVAGDGACFGELIERWEQKIYAFICRYIGDREEARDLTQDTFTKAYQNLARLSDPKRFSSWLYTIALNECRMRFRRNQRHHRVSIGEGEQEIELEDRSEVTPEIVVARKERERALHLAFQKLPDEQRIVIVMKEYQGLKFYEIADILELPLSTVKSRMYMGLKTLRRILEDGT